jgi:hypothetical protein
MKQVTFFALCATLMAILTLSPTGACFAQNRQALLGSGQVVNVPVPALQPFSELELYGIPGGSNSVVEIVVGPTTAVTVSADDNLVSRFRVEQKGAKLSIGLPNNRDNREWIEDTNIRIHIQTPSLTALDVASNGYTVVRGLEGTLLEVDKSQNGNLRLFGQVAQLKLRKTGNGEVYADSLVVQTANVRSVGNGSVHVQVNGALKTERSGNGDILNSGKGPIEKGLDTGNGETRSAGETPAATTPVVFVEVTLVNTQHIRRNLTVAGRATKKFSYGIELGPLARRTEQFPVGTEIRTRLGKVLYTVQASDAGKTVELD